MAEPVFKDLHGLLQSLRGDLFTRWMRRAQKQALIEWRDRTAPPGLMARFERSGIDYYNFSARTRPRKAGYYLRTGGLRNQLRKRRPLAKNKKSKDEVTTLLKYGGGALNFLVNRRGIKSITTHATVTSVSMPATSRQAHTYARRGAQFQRGGCAVRAYTYQRVSSYNQGVPASTSYAAEFAQFTRDGEWIRRRADALFAQIARRASVDRRTGGIKSSVLEAVDNDG